jgi:hypothetical protein
MTHGVINNGGYMVENMENLFLLFVEVIKVVLILSLVVIPWCMIGDTFIRECLEPHEDLDDLTLLGRIICLPILVFLWSWENAAKIKFLFVKKGKK